MVTNEAGTYTCVIVHREVLQNVQVGSRESSGLGSNARDLASEFAAQSRLSSCNH